MGAVVCRWCLIWSCAVVQDAGEVCWQQRSSAVVSIFVAVLSHTQVSNVLRVV
jgi:hypothetical protein